MWLSCLALLASPTLLALLMALRSAPDHATDDLGETRSVQRVAAHEFRERLGGVQRAIVAVRLRGGQVQPIGYEPSFEVGAVRWGGDDDAWSACVEACAEKITYRVGKELICFVELDDML